MKAKKILKTVAILAMLFGAVTILSGGRALFGGVEARAAVGNAVPFVLWFNFFAGFLYIAAGAGFYLKKPWSVPLSVFLLVSNLIVFAAFGLHVMGGAAYEMRTVGAMTIRTLFWALAAAVSIRALGCMFHRCKTENKSGMNH